MVKQLDRTREMIEFLHGNIATVEHVVLVENCRNSNWTISTQDPRSRKGEIWIIHVLPATITESRR